MNPAIIGRSLPRPDGPDLVTAAAQFTGGMVLPGMLRAKVLRSPHPHARIVDVDASRAERLVGVTVLTRDDLRAFADPRFGSVVRDQPIVATDRVRHVGDPVAAVAAPDLDRAAEALDLIDVEYEPLAAVFDPVAAMEPGSPVLHPGPSTRPDHFKDPDLYHYQSGSNSLMAFHVRRGDVDMALGEADEVFDDTYTTPVVQHGHLETHAATAYWTPAGKLVVYCPSQNPWIVRDQLASLFGLPGSLVRIVVPYIGGGYGAKTHARIEPLVAALARKSRRPVQLALTREEVFATAVRHASVVRITTGVRRDGLLLGRRVEVVYDTGAYAHTGPMTAKSGGVVSAGPYRIHHQDLTAHCVYTNKPPAGPFRGFGVPQVCWAYEQQMDDIARRLAIDPVDIRLRNLVRGGDQFVTGQEFVAIDLQGCLEQVAAAIDWDGQVATPNTSEKGRVRGKGVACTIKTTMTPSNSAASLRLNADGSAVVHTSSAEMGQGIRAALAQLASEALGIPVGAVTIASPDTDVTPYDTSTSSSRSVFSMGNAVVAAGTAIRDQVLDIAAEALEAHRDDIELAEGQAWVQGVPEGAIGIPDLFRHKFGRPVGSLFGTSDYQTEGGLDPETGLGRATTFFFAAACAAEVEVDTETGKVTVVRMATSVDVGRPISPDLCHMQNEGSMIMGLGTALTEELVFDGGQPTNSSFADYTLPSIIDQPSVFESILVETPHPDGPYGAKGVGEAAIPAIAPAIGNAVANALGGVRLRDMPLHPERVLRACRPPRSR